MTRWSLSGPGDPTDRLTEVADAPDGDSAGCMRTHGVTGLPDPTIATGSGPPDLNPADHSSRARARRVGCPGIGSARAPYDDDAAQE